MEASEECITVCVYSKLIMLIFDHFQQLVNTIEDKHTHKVQVASLAVRLISSDGTMC